MMHAFPKPAPLRIHPRPEELPGELVEFDARAELRTMLWAVPAFLLMFLAFAVMMPGGPGHG